MGKETFQKSKDVVLEIIATMIGTKAQMLAANAGRSA
jgi:hypothetical protein